MKALRAIAVIIWRLVVCSALIMFSWVCRAFKAVTNTHLENTLIGRLLQGDGGGGDRGGL